MTVTVEWWNFYNHAPPEFPTHVVVEDLNEIIQGLELRDGLVFGINPYEIDERTGGLNVYFFGPDAYELPALIEFLDREAAPGHRIRLSLYYFDEFFERYGKNARVATLDVDVDIAVSWNPGWQTAAPDLWITTSTESPAPPKEVEQALEQLLGPCNIHYVAVTRANDALVVHADGIRAPEDVQAIISALDRLDDSFGITAITVGE